MVEATRRSPAARSCRTRRTRAPPGRPSRTSPRRPGWRPASSLRPAGSPSVVGGVVAGGGRRCVVVVVVAVVVCAGSVVGGAASLIGATWGSEPSRWLVRRWSEPVVVASPTVATVVVGTLIVGATVGAGDVPVAGACRRYRGRRNGRRGGRGGGAVVASVARRWCRGGRRRMSPAQEETRWSMSGQGQRWLRLRRRPARCATGPRANSVAPNTAASRRDARVDRLQHEPAHVLSPPHQPNSPHQPNVEARRERDVSQIVTAIDRHRRSRPPPRPGRACFDTLMS